jgi:predicted permease
MLFNQPGFSLAAIVVLALGIGGSTAMFSIVNELLLKPLAMQNSNEIVGLYSRDSRKPDSYRAFSYPNYADLREKNAAFSAVMAHNMAMVGLAEGDTTRRVFADVVSSNYFATLGSPLFRGRAFTPDEERPGSGIPVVIVSHAYWRKNGSDPDLIGKTRQINGKIVTIVGITAEGFTGTTALLSPELYLPLGMYESAVNDFDGHGRMLAARDNPALILIGRLRPGVTESSANASLQVVADRMAQAYPAENKDQVLSVHPLSRMSISDAPMKDNELLVPSGLLIAMAGVVLLIASLNVANMMLARGAARGREIAIRQALGAGRRNILQQLFTEGLVLALIGGAAGILLASSGTSILMNSMSRLAPVDLLFDASPDARVLLATLGFCVLSALLFSLGPARILSRTSIVAGIKSGESQDTLAGKSRVVFSRRNMLVMSQIALSMMLLTASGLFIRSAIATARVEPGFQMDHRLLLEVDASMAGYDEAHGRQLYRTLIDRLRGMPGVESASMAATVPFGMISLGRSVQLPGGAPVGCRFNVIADDYFKTLDIPLLQGRAFNQNEAGAKTSGVVMLDRLAADRLWPADDAAKGTGAGKGSGAVGKHIQLLATGGASGSQDVEVVGVVANVQENVFGGGLQPHVYVPFGQEYQADMNIHLKLASQPGKGGDTGAGNASSDAQFLETARREVASVDSRLPVLALTTMRDQLDSSVELWIVRTAARLFSIFGGVALLLAMVGLYSLRAYTVTRRTREIGIRLALGAQPSDARQMILREGLVVTAIGAGSGLVLSLLAGRVLTSLLYKVSGVDPLVFFSSAAILGMVSLLACYLPALRASRVDPMIALRHD